MPRKTSTIADPVYLSPDKNDDTPKTKDELRQEALDGVLQLAQFGCLAFGNFADAGAIGLHGRPMADEVVNLAKQNAKVASKVDLLIEIGPYAGIVAATIPFLAQLFVNHGLFKAEQFANAGVVSPDALEAKMKTQMMEQAMQAMREQQQAEERLFAMQEEMAAQMNGDHSPNAE
jgi:hypothetical protein